MIAQPSSISASVEDIRQRLFELFLQQDAFCSAIPEIVTLLELLNEEKKKKEKVDGWESWISEEEKNNNNNTLLHIAASMDNDLRGERFINLLLRRESTISTKKKKKIAATSASIDKENNNNNNNYAFHLENLLFHPKILAMVKKAATEDAQIAHLWKKVQEGGEEEQKQQLAPCKHQQQHYSFLSSSTRQLPMFVNRDGYTALHLAAIAGNFRCFRAILRGCSVEEEGENEEKQSAIAAWMNAVHGHTNDTILHMAARNGNVKLVQFILETLCSDTFLLAKNNAGQSALCTSISCGHFLSASEIFSSCLKTIMDATASSSASSFSPSANWSQEMRDVLTMLCRLNDSRYAEMIQTILSQKWVVTIVTTAEIRKQFRSNLVVGNWPVASAILKGNWTTKERLEIVGTCFFHEVITAFPSPQTRDICIAESLSSFPELFPLLLEWNHEEEIFLDNVEGGEDQRMGLFKLILDSCKDEKHRKKVVNSLGSYGRTFLHYASQWGNLNIAREILKKENGFDRMLTIDEGGSTALSLCIEHDHLDCFLEILDACKNSDQRDKLIGINDGTSSSKTFLRTDSDILSFAAAQNATKILLEILRPDGPMRREYRFEPSEKMLRKTLFYAANSGSLECFRSIICDCEDEEEKKKLVNSRDDCGWTILHEAAKNGRTGIVQEILEETGCARQAGFSRFLTVDNEKGWTALHFAAAEKQYLVVDMLLSHAAGGSGGGAANVTCGIQNMRDRNGMTALHLACSKTREASRVITPSSAREQANLEKTVAALLFTHYFHRNPPVSDSVKRFLKFQIRSSELIGRLDPNAATGVLM